MQHTKDADTAANWMLGDFSRQVNDKEIRYDAIPFAMKDLADLLALVENQTIHLNAAKKVLRSMFETGGKPGDIVEKEGLSQITDTGALEKIVDEVLDANPQSIEDIKGGKDRALGFLVGQCMKASKGKGNPQTMRQLLEEKIAQR
jgi:aspartyl-tRNA(Asn)/glutamyl-tRNA(Gln) amidotransferase subunit B